MMRRSDCGLLLRIELLNWRRFGTDSFGLGPPLIYLPLGFLECSAVAALGVVAVHRDLLNSYYLHLLL